MALLHLLFIVGLAFAQHPGSQKENEHLSMKIQECSSGGSCKDGKQTIIMHQEFKRLIEVNLLL